jgi:hypothetical protein
MFRSSTIFSFSPHTSVREHLDIRYQWRWDIINEHRSSCKMSVLLSSFNQNWNVLTNICKNWRFGISWKYVWWELACSKADRHDSCVVNTLTTYVLIHEIPGVWERCEMKEKFLYWKIFTAKQNQHDFWIAKISNFILLSTLLWIFAQSRLVCYRCFRTAYGSHLKGSRCARSTPEHKPEMLQVHLLCIDA